MYDPFKCPTRPSLFGSRLNKNGDKVVRIERWFARDYHEGKYGRLRDVVEGPDGSLYFLTSNREGRGSPKPGDDKIYRIVPKENVLPSGAGP